MPDPSLAPKATEENWTYAGDLNELWEGEMCGVSLAGLQLVMCNVDGQVFVYADRCPHLSSRLSEGRLDGRLITCAAHEWVFDACSGHGVNPRTVCLLRYPVQVVEDVIFVNLEAAGD